MLKVAVLSLLVSAQVNIDNSINVEAKKAPIVKKEIVTETVRPRPTKRGGIGF